MTLAMKVVKNDFKKTILISKYKLVKQTVLLLMPEMLQIPRGHKKESEVSLSLFSLFF
jgi:hypothetical protein